MVIATFNSATGWAGKTITHDNGVFTLEGHGAISAVDVLTYDRQGHISWAYEGLREWVQQLAATSAVAAPQVQPIGVAPPLTLAGPRVEVARSHKARNIVVGIVAALVVLVVITVAVGSQGGQSPSKTATTATTPTPKATPAATQPAVGSPSATQPNLAERVAAALHVRTDFTSFAIPTPKIEVTGSAAGGGKTVGITYYISGDDIFNENAFVDGVSPATVDVMAGAFSQPDVSIVDVTWKTDFTDAYGKSSREEAFQILWKRKTFEKVDINGLFSRCASSPEDLYMISDGYYIHPAIWKATHLKDQIPVEAW